MSEAQRHIACSHTHGAYRTLQGGTAPITTYDILLTSHSEVMVLSKMNAPDNAEYLEFLKRVTPDNQEEFMTQMRRFNLGPVGEADCPVFDGMFDYFQVASAACPYQLTHRFQLSGGSASLGCAADDTHSVVVFAVSDLQRRIGGRGSSYERRRS